MGVVGAIAGWSLQSWVLIGLGLVQPALPPARSITPIDYASRPFENPVGEHDLTSDGAVTHSSLSVVDVASMS